ncbi:MAG: hypothetical protein CUN55_02905 [Phototrophicales bacterium]|nr:MAG: hypothetical protein CUN55_02905 [Phototrophicales bacterium]
MKKFIQGPYGTGKTTLALQYLQDYFADGNLAHQLLILVPQRTLGRVYQQVLSQLQYPNTASVEVITFSGLAQRAIERFWPLLHEQVGFATGKPPIFLTIETAQYHIAQFVDDVVVTGRFDSVSVARARLIAQSLDNLAKAAINRFSLEEVAERLSSAWGGHSSRLEVYDAWLSVAERFRQYCLQHNLLDFSLQIEVFTQYAMAHPLVQETLRQRYRHLIAENLEENSPVVFDFLQWMLPELDSALLLFDQGAGFRLFLGAEPNLAYQLQEACDEVITLSESYVQSPPLRALEQAVIAAFDGVTPEELIANPTDAFVYELHAFYPQMLEWAVDEILRLVQSGVAPSEIVVIAPFLNDALRFAVMSRLEDAGVPIASHRPSRAIREEPSARAMLTLMQLVNPYEAVLPPPEDVANALTVLLPDLDPVRASLLTELVYGIGRKELGSFDDIQPIMQARITYTVGERYELLRQWLLEQREYVSQTPPDHFLRRLFGDMVAQPGFALQTDFDAATAISQMVESAFEFRRSLYPEGTTDWAVVWQEYRELVTEGLLAATYVPSWQKELANTVFIAPAYTYLMRNRPATYQFWLDVGSPAWGERLEQPLTNPYVVRREYPIGELWTDEHEMASNYAALRKLVLGLIRRCRQRIYLGVADLGEQGFEQRGPLLYLFQQILNLNTEVKES